ncbi:MAG: hypothetical protein OZ927_02180 [Alcaligenaceae bacterium]|nr:hypothetical protein [Alcaligenaceae bacterium]
MNPRELDAEKIAMLIGNSGSAADAFALYRLAAPLMKEYKFVFASDTGGSAGFAVNRTFSAGAAVRSLFKTSRALVMDAETVVEMEAGQATYPIDYSISLDANAMSYLVPYMAGTRGGGIPTDFQEVFEFIARPDVFVDPLPYFTENLPRLANGKSADKIFKNIEAYEILRTIDADWLRSNGEIRSTLSDQELSVKAAQQMSQMYFDIGNTAAMKGLMRGHQYLYAHLLKMVMIQLNSPGATVGTKMEAFLEFCHSSLATMNTREASIARAYFTRGQNLTFFGKIQKRKTGILELLRNMTWDLWHVRQLELSSTFKPAKEARYFFPALLTFDQKLIEIMDLYPLKAYAFKTGSYQPLAFFDGDPFKLIATDDGDGASAVEKYFSDDAIEVREAARGSVKANFHDVIKSLETELLTVVGN